MAINFGQFTTDLVNFFESYSARNERDTARFITNLYITNVLQGTDVPFRNVVIKFNKDALEIALNNAFNIAFNGNTNTHFSQVISVGLIRFWTSGALALTVSPPGSIRIVSNIVTIPGILQTLRIPTFPPRKSATHREFANELVQMFRRHMLTLQGITTALVPAPTGAPIPTPFPWSGYR